MLHAQLLLKHRPIKNIKQEFSFLKKNHALFNPNGPNDTAQQDLLEQARAVIGELTR